MTSNLTSKKPNMLLFFFNDPAPTEISTLPLPAALPIYRRCCPVARHRRNRRSLRWTTSSPIPGLLSATLPQARAIGSPVRQALRESPRFFSTFSSRSEEHTSELQSPCNLVCRLLLEKKK